MMVRRAACALLLAALAPRAWATDAPHDMSSNPAVSCMGCHVAHRSLGAKLTKSEKQATLCGSCHVQGLGFGFPWSTGDQAVPGASGRSHAWSGPPSSARHGAETPTNATLLALMPDGEMECTSCHDAHGAARANGGTQHVSVRTGTALTHAAGSGSGRMTVNPPGASAIAKGYRIRIGPDGGFRISHDAGLPTPSWFGWDSANGAWGAGLAAGHPISAGAAVALDDPAVTVTFDSGTFAEGDRWDFYVSYPFLRVSNANDAMCEDCHRSRVQSRLDVEGKPGGKLASIVIGRTRFSHPTGESVVIPATAGYHVPLDADGGSQLPSRDGDTSNDLLLDASGQVRCTTCHRMHDADSNSLSEDGR